MTDIANLWRFELRGGSSADPRHGACLLDAVSWLEYGTLGDHPPCVCPDAIAPYARLANDFLPHLQRQRLKIFIPRLVGTVDPDAVRPRIEFLVRHTVRALLPLAFDERLPRVATSLRALPPDASMADCRTAAGTADRAAASYTRAYGPFVLHDGAAKWTAAARAAARAAFARAPADAAKAAAEAAVFVGDATLPVHAYARGTLPVYDAVIAGLDGMLRIGRQAEPLDVGSATEAVHRFAAARGEAMPA
jgi:hypothetical protein